MKKVSYLTARWYSSRTAGLDWGNASSMRPKVTSLSDNDIGTNSDKVKGIQILTLAPDATSSP
jgi:hypothetical protein